MQAVLILSTAVCVYCRRQTRLTALDLIAFAAADEKPQQFVHMPEAELEAVTATVKVGPNKPLGCAGPDVHEMQRHVQPKP